MSFTAFITPRFQSVPEFAMRAAVRAFPCLTSPLDKPFIGVTLSDAKRDAIAAIASDDKHIGGVAAERILFRNLTTGIALADIPVESPELAIVAVNLSIARRFGISISERALRAAHFQFE